MNKRGIVLLALFAIASGLVLFGDKAPPDGGGTDVVQPRAQRPATAHRAAPTKATLPGLIPVVTRATLWDSAQARAPIRDLFAARNWNLPAPPPARALEPPPPTAPALPFVYQGKRFDGTAWEVFLGHGDRTLIVRAGSVVEDLYRVDSVQPPALALTYLPLAQAQTLPIGGTE